MGNKVSLDDQIFNLKFQSKQMEKRYEKYEKDSKKKKKKIKKYLQEGNKEMAAEYARQSIAAHQSGMTFLKLSSKLDAVRSRMESAKSSQQMVPMMAKTVQSMDVALQQMNVEKITATMDKFEAQFGELDVRTGYMDQAMGAVTASLTPEEDIDNLMQQVADEHDLQLVNQLDNAGPVPSQVPGLEQQQPAVTEEVAEAEMEAALAQLRAELA
jgi:charged multivesicular body protein 1|tara:strand:+ start:120 stop:758 length:639 start_codon:yes stop_codon:yes gene_type:complete